MEVRLGKMKWLPKKQLSTSFSSLLSTAENCGYIMDKYFCNKN